jgi:hypothetical protein
MILLARVATGILLAAALGLVSAQTAASTVPPSKVGDHSSIVTANKLKPVACTALTLAVVVTGAVGALDGTAANDLVLGGPGAAPIGGGDGDDCILAASAAAIDGGQGADVCIAPFGAAFSNCETEINH